MSSRDAIATLLKDAAASMKSDPKGAVAMLQSAYALAAKDGDADETALVAEELSRGWNRRKSPARSLHYARKSTKLAPERKAAWATLGKTCELIALKTPSDRKLKRMHALHRGAATAFKKAASLTKDAEDKHFLLDLAADNARQAKPR